MDNEIKRVEKDHELYFESVQRQLSERQLTREETMARARRVASVGVPAEERKDDFTH
jgi:hypothetical protein